MTDLTVYFELANLRFPLQNEMRFKIKLKLDFMKILLHLCTLEYINGKMPTTTNRIEFESGMLKN